MYAKAYSDGSQDHQSQPVPLDEMQAVLKRKAQDLFALCDLEMKGFASKRDMYRLLSHLPLTPDQLDEVFDTLDKDGNECLTLEEFTEGLGMFLGIECRLEDEGNQIAKNSEREKALSAQEEEKFEDFLDHLGANNVFSDEDYIKQMWDRVQKDDPAMLQNFENFLGKVTHELQSTKMEQESLETTLKERNNIHEEQVQALYAEMEAQLLAEKELILTQERGKEQKLRNELETELNLKDQQLQELLTKHLEIEKRLQELNADDSEKKHENVKLHKERDGLELQLSASDRMLKDMQLHLDLLRKKSLEERRKRAQAALKVSEGIALERENLALELEKLKKANKRLRDEKDELVQSSSALLSVAKPINVVSSSAFNSNPVVEHSSNDKNMMANKVQNAASDSSICMDSGQLEFLFPLSAKSDHNNTQGLSDDECEVDDKFFIGNPHFLGLTAKERQSLQNNLNVEDTDHHRHRKVSKVCSADTRPKTPVNNILDEPNSNLNSPSLTPRQRHSSSGSTGRSRKKDFSSLNTFVKLPANQTGVEEPPTPERLFKVVFIGDSGVGKSSIVHRFCHNTFKSAFSATIGVDFQMKTINLNGKLIALQLWDTAGQERFRSMTNQYFRKADGIVVVYDVTSESSFKNVRKWIADVRECVDENAILMLLGNKTDMCESDEDRVVKTKHGCRLSEEFESLFFETSAKNGSNIEEALQSFSSVLKKKEDEGMEKVLELQKSEKRRKKICCSLE